MKHEYEKIYNTGKNILPHNVCIPLLDSIWDLDNPVVLYSQSQGGAEDEPARQTRPPDTFTVSYNCTIRSSLSEIVPSYDIIIMYVYVVYLINYSYIVYSYSTLLPCGASV